jgi:hypothetical protein
VAEGTADRVRFIRDGAADWAGCVAPVDSFAAAHPDILHTLNYEAMIADPAGEARKLYRFLGVRHDEAVIARVVGATSFEAMTGRRPGEEHPTSFLRKGVAGDWVGKLEAPGLAAIEETCGALMRKHGYE